MKMKKIILWAMVVLFVAPATLQAGWGWGSGNKEKKKEQQAEQRQENREFRPALKEKTPEEKQAAIQKHHEAQLAENKVFQQAMHDKQMAELKARLAQNAKLTEAQKSEIVFVREKRYEKNMIYGDQTRSENDAFFQQLAGDPNMTKDQKRDAIRAHFQGQKSANQAFRQQQKADSKAEREKIHSEVAS